MGPMNDLNLVIEQMVLDIVAQACQLEEPRLEMFLNWLSAHSGTVKEAAKNGLGLEAAALRGTEMREQFKAALQLWLQSLPARGLLWEYQTISTEITWWRDLDPIRLKTIVKSETER